MEHQEHRYCVCSRCICVMHRLVADMWPVWQKTRQLANTCSEPTTESSKSSQSKHKLFLCSSTTRPTKAFWSLPPQAEGTTLPSIPALPSSPPPLSFSPILPSPSFPPLLPSFFYFFPEFRGLLCPLQQQKPARRRKELSTAAAGAKCVSHELHSAARSAVSLCPSVHLYVWEGWEWAAVMSPAG